MAEFVFRSASPGEMPQFEAVTNYVFANTSSPEGQQAPNPLLPEWSHCAFDGEWLVASSGAYPFRVQVNGVPTSMHGVTAVGTDPGYRRRGLVRRLITDLLHRARDEGCSGSILLASMGAIYQRFGYGLAFDSVIYDFDPRFAVLERPRAIEGRVRLVPQDEAREALADVFRAFCSPRHFMAHRPAVVWDQFLTAPGQRDAWVALFEDASGKPAGYCVYRTRWDEDEGSGKQVLTVVDHAWTTLDAWHGLWQFICGHDLVHRVRWHGVPADDPAPMLLLEPRVLGRRVHDGIWYRVVDTVRAMTERGYDMDGDVVIEVTGDTLIDANNGRYGLAARRDGASVETTQDVADLTVDPNGLAMLLAGYATASELVKCGRATDAVATSLPLLDAVFSTRTPGTLSFGF